MLISVVMLSPPILMTSTRLSYVGVSVYLGRSKNGTRISAVDAVCLDVMDELPSFVNRYLYMR